MDTHPATFTEQKMSSLLNMGEMLILLTLPLPLTQTQTLTRNDLAGLGFAIGINRVCDALDGLLAAAGGGQVQQATAGDGLGEAPSGSPEGGEAQGRVSSSRPVPKPAPTAPLTASAAREMLEARGIVAPPAAAAAAAAAASEAEAEGLADADAEV